MDSTGGDVKDNQEKEDGRKLTTGQAGREEEGREMERRRNGSRRKRRERNWKRKE